MKIIHIFIALLIFATPAFGITVSSVDEGDGVVRIIYDANNESALPLAFALDITVDNGATIAAVTDYKVGDSTKAAPGYGIFPRSILFDDTGTMVDPGFPDVKPDGSATGVEPGLGTKGITLEMASRYNGAENAPLKAAILLKLNIDNNGASEVNVHIAPNTAGGGVVLENANVPTVTAVGCTLTFADEPLPENVAPVITLSTASPSVIDETGTSQLQLTANDPDESPSVLTYKWLVPAGAGNVGNTTSSVTTYFPPDVTETKTFAITAEVTDGKDIATSIVNITVQPEVVEPPVIEPDTITIIKAQYKSRRKELQVEATSSNQPTATLRVEGYGAMIWNAKKSKYALKIKPVELSDDKTIQVTSSSGTSVDQKVNLRR